MSNNEINNYTSNKKEKIVLLSHGAGGQLQNELIRFITKNAKIRKVADGIGLDAFDDGATIPLKDGDKDIVITSDGHTISPIFFPGGDIGQLAATGAINDLLMMGATPTAISSTVFIEEGFPFKDLKKIFNSFYKVLESCNVALLCGDTKVFPKGTLDKIAMATTAIGFKPSNIKITDSNLQEGDKIIITGTIGDHGASLIANRKEINLNTTLTSDVAVLLPIIKAIENLKWIHAMKDPTRGGIAAALNEWAEKSKVSIILDESKLPIKKEVKAIADILGLDPLELSNEGKALIAVKKDYADIVLKRIKNTEIGKNAEIIGEVSKENAGKVMVRTTLGGTKFINMPIGEPVPRVC
ncbi:MAG: hydrogenase expression/formation protein HypE [Promethearchaeota archaeon]